MSESENHHPRIQSQFEVPLDAGGSRIDVICAEIWTDFSRARLSQWISAGAIRIDGQQVKPKYKVLGGELVTVDAQPESQVTWVGQPLDLQTLFVDEHLIIVNKPAGLVVHPGHGNPSHTLVNALLHHYPELDTIPRAGIVHRLDKDTSGVLAIARSPKAHQKLIAQLKDRSMGRQYWALVFGKTRSVGTIDAPMDRHRIQRTRMAVMTQGKPAVTHYRTLQQTAHVSAIEVRLETGRTHQIRVHMTHLGHPLVGDPVYKAGRPGFGTMLAPVRARVDAFPRQALHAESLRLIHPATGEPMSFTAPLADDLVALMHDLQRDDH